MNNELIQSGSTQILIDAIEKPPEVIKILEEAKEKIEAMDVRFRLRSWNDKSVVHVPDWIIGEGALKSVLPELAERVYYDPDYPSRIDCYVGLVGRIGRIKEEQMKEKRDENKLQELKKYVSEKEITNPRICFNEMQNQKEFKKL